MTTPACEYCGLVTLAPCTSAVQGDHCPHAPESAIIPEGALRGLRRKHYRVIYADPPWTYETYSDKGKGRSPEQHYECMTLDEIKALPIQEIAAKDCVLFMWVIDTHLPMALDVMAAWGFTYKTKGFNWVKLNNLPDNPTNYPDVTDPSAYFTGMGHWSRANPEDCLLATRGKPQRNEKGKGVRRLVVAERREHSRKPDEVYSRIETLVPGPYCELFARTARRGWDQAGDQVGKFGFRYQPLPDAELSEIEDLL